MHDVIQKKMIVTQNNEYSHISVKTVLRSVNLGSLKLIEVMLVALLTSAFLGAGGVLAGKYAKNRFNALENLWKCLKLSFDILRI